MGSYNIWIILVQYMHYVFSNRLFQLFSHMKIHKFGIVGKKRLSSFINRGLEKTSSQKKFFGLRVVAPYEIVLTNSICQIWYVSNFGIKTFNAFRCRIDNIQSMQLMIWSDYGKDLVQSWSRYGTDMVSDDHHLNVSTRLITWSPVTWYFMSVSR